MIAMTDVILSPLFSWGTRTWIRQNPLGRLRHYISALFFLEFGSQESTLDVVVVGDI